MENNQINLRNIVLNMLTQTTSEGGFSHVLINKTFSDFSLDKHEKAFISRLYLGTLEKMIFLDFIINSYSSVSTQKMKGVIKNILRMGAYQILFMDNVPDHAAINESVKLANKKGFSNLKGFVNGVLRTIQREKIPEDIPENVKYCVPKRFYELCINRFGIDEARSFFENINQTSEYIWARLNMQSSSKEEIIKLLEEDGCEVIENEEIDEAVQIRGFSSLTDLSAYKKGLIFIQDFSSMNIAHYARVLTKNKDVRLILDVCAAPGGKSTHMAAKFPDAFVYARDLSKNKTDLIDENIKRLKLKNIQSQIFDATINDNMMAQKADIVLADLPCSGLGIIGHKPDIKLRVKEKDLKELASLQRKILGVVYQYVKNDGMLIYSTCTINEEENEKNTRWFLDNYPFELVKEMNFLPGRDNCDGFYIAFMKRK